jgi:hypothetical protein
VEIEAHGPDLVITAHKTRFVRVNWQSLNLEGSQRDYRLRLRLGVGFDLLPDAGRDRRRRAHPVGAQAPGLPWRRRTA